MKIDLDDIEIKKEQPPHLKQHAFKKGNKMQLLKYDKPAKPLTVYDVRNMESMKTFRKFMQSYGISRIMELMQTLPPDEFFKVFILLAPYSLPKIASIEARDADGKEVHDITDMQQSHTITIKDMRTGSTTTILSE